MKDLQGSLTWVCSAPTSLQQQQYGHRHGHRFECGHRWQTLQWLGHGSDHSWWLGGGPGSQRFCEASTSSCRPQRDYLLRGPAPGARYVPSHELTQLYKSRKTTAFSQQPLLLNACVSSEWQWRWDWVAPEGPVPCWAPQLEVEPDPQHRCRPEEHGQHLLPELSSAVSHLHGSVHQLHVDTGALQNLWVFAPRCYFSHAVI